MNESNLSDEALAELLTLTVEVNKHGTIRYLDHLGQLHRIHGPAVIRASGSKAWYLNGQCHREDGPAVEYADGGKYWYINNVFVTEQEFHERIKTIR